MPYMRKAVCKDQISVCYGDSNRCLKGSLGQLGCVNEKYQTQFRHEGRREDYEESVRSSYQSILVDFITSQIISTWISEYNF